MTAPELRAFDLATPEALERLRTAMLAADPPGVPMSTRDLTDYPGSLDEPRQEYPQSGTAREMAVLLRQGTQERDEEEGQ
jgi:hypothetical protein